MTSGDLVAQFASGVDGQLGRRLVVVFSTASGQVSVAQRHIGMES